MDNNLVWIAVQWQTLCNIIATNTISVRWAVDMETAAPIAMPSAEKKKYCLFSYLQETKSLSKFASFSNARA